LGLLDLLNAPGDLFTVEDCLEAIENGDTFFYEGNTIKIHPEGLARELQVRMQACRVAAQQHGIGDDAIVSDIPLDFSLSNLVQDSTEISPGDATAIADHYRHLQVLFTNPYRHNQLQITDAVLADAITNAQAFRRLEDGSTLSLMVGKDITVEDVASKWSNLR
jgi:hypothetical protein